MAEPWYILESRRKDYLHNKTLYRRDYPCRAGEHDIPEGYVRVAAVHGVPAEVLYAVSLTETVMAPSAIAGVMKKRDADFRLPSDARPWPWTINVAGKG